MSSEPSQPTVGVGAVVIRDGRVLLIKRGKEPLRGRWLVPGGAVELGETLAEAVVREVREETGLEVSVREMITVVDHIDRHESRIQYHYVIVDYLCEGPAGEPQAGSDAAAVAFVGWDDLAAYDLPPAALEVVREGFRRLAK